jgi:hypothetical protein
MAGTRRNESAAAAASGVGTKRRRSMIDWEWLKLTAKIALVWVASAALFGWLMRKLIRQGGGGDDGPPMV